MAKKVRAVIKLQLAAGQASPAPPVGPALGQHGVNIMAFVKEYNSRTANQGGNIVPVHLTVFEDRSFTFVTKTPPASDMLRQSRRHRKRRVSGPGEGRRRQAQRPGGNRQAEDGRPERQGPGRRNKDYRRHRPQHGHRN